MMKALVVVFPTSSLSNTMPSCRICRHRDFPSARHPQQHQHLVWRQQVELLFPPAITQSNGMQLYGPTLASLCSPNSADIVLRLATMANANG